MGDTMSTMFAEASDKAKETPGQTTPVVRAYASVVLNELISTYPASGDTTNNTYQVARLRFDLAEVEVNTC